MSPNQAIPTSNTMSNADQAAVLCRLLEGTTWALPVVVGGATTARCSEVFGGVVVGEVVGEVVELPFPPSGEGGAYPLDIGSEKLWVGSKGSQPKLGPKYTSGQVWASASVTW
jgi:hypothetical protein